MTFWIINIILTFFLCVFFTGIVIPQILLIAFRKKLFDMPDERKIHKAVVPRLGGMAFKPVMFFSIALLLGISLALGHLEMLTEISKDIKILAFGICSILALYLLGMADDLIGVRYRAKFVIQILCAIMVIAGGFWIENLHGICGIYHLSAWIGYPLTVLIIVFIINAINLIDGLDGLASGLCSVAVLFYGTAFFVFRHYFCSMVSFAAMGVLVSFFYYNVFGNPQKRKQIFMGDTGSLTIGMVICLLSIKLSICAPATADALNPVALAFIPLFIPCFDVVRVYFHRVRNGQNPFLPDKNHIHHKLLAIGMRQRSAMITIVAISTLLSLSNILLLSILDVTLLLIANIAAWILANIWLSRKIKKTQEIVVETQKS
jgi:UDP-N-acetylmuramyl pentapeptide phosphotransferase/UDP-N-acetylglucosamine-1-phosphate transferase